MSIPTAETIRSLARTATDTVHLILTRAEAIRLAYIIEAGEFYLERESEQGSSEEAKP